MKYISIVTPCYNEEENIQAIYEQIKAVFADLPEYKYEHIFIDNASTDKTVELVKGIIKQDKNVKLLVNMRNFGHIRSPYNGILQANGDAVVVLASDLQDPPYLIKDFLQKWEEGYKVVVGVKPESQETPLMFAIRKLYYTIISRISNVPLIKNFTGFGLYDKSVIEILRGLNEPYPYFRGLISELGFEAAQIPYLQPNRVRGISKNNFYTLYDLAMLGITNHSKVPLRLAAMAGFLLSGLSFIAMVMFFILKLLFWQYIAGGTAPLIISLFFFSSVQLFFIGLLGEYIGTIHTQVMKRPLVIEKERVNF